MKFMKQKRRSGSVSIDEIIDENLIECDVDDGITFFTYTSKNNSELMLEKYAHWLACHEFVFNQSNYASCHLQFARI
jgi:hypothetical protein